MGSRCLHCCVIHRPRQLGGRAYLGTNPFSSSEFPLFIYFMRRDFRDVAIATSQLTPVQTLVLTVGVTEVLNATPILAR